MNPPNGEETIFAEALRLPAAERALYVARSTEGNAELRRRIEALLGSYEAGSFLEDAVAPDLRSAVPVSEKPGDVIGRYKLLQQIGEGGCGVVYMAEQSEPVRRRVALKIIKLGMDTKSVIARFEAERQALAMMDHPNIAKVFEAGATETGRPYFVMELVRGLKITDYCDEAKLSTRARLDLFIDVCQAIQHAHQKGIIHRDIKPSNILVTVNDGIAVPKVIDFGIAKATSGQQLTDKTLFTAFEQFIGTPAYMSPEQAVLTSLDIDTRSDIYALGVLLYELLTGKTPFDSKELLAIGLDEMRRTIREKEPQQPSTCLSTLGGDELSTMAQRRGLEAPKLVSELRGDLDWIVMKALEKDRARRYETANGLAADVLRHINNEPVVACPPSALYRFKKALHRNKLAFAAATAVVTALLMGLGLSTWMFLREREALHRAIAAERSERQLRQEAELRELNMRALQMAGHVSDGDAINARQEVLEQQRKVLAADHPDIADSLEELARLFRSNGNLSAAESFAKEALVIRRKNAPQGDLKLARSLSNLAYLVMDSEKYEEGEETAREAMAILERIEPGKSPAKASAAGALGFSYVHRERWRDALMTLEKALENCQTLPKGDMLIASIEHSLILACKKTDNLSRGAELARDLFPQFQDRLPPVVLAGLVDLAEKLFKAQGGPAARAMLDDIVTAAGQNTALLRIRAEYLARHGEWNDALADFRELSRPVFEGKNPKLVYNDFCHKLAALLVQVGDIAGYVEHCAKSLQKFADSKDGLIAHLVSKDALILPHPAIDVQTAGKLADVSANHGASAHVIATKALADYRRGDFANAAKWGEQVAHDGDRGWVAADGAFVLAMARQKLGQLELAREAFAIGREIAFTRLPDLMSSDVGHDFLDIIIMHALMREAAALIGETLEGEGQ